MNVTMRGLTARIIREGVDDESVFIAENNFYCYISNSGSPAAVYQVILQKVQERISEFEFDTSAEFEIEVLESFKKAGAKNSITFSCIYSQDDTVFLVTQSQGEIYIQRNGKTIKLLDGNRHAMGKLQDDDIFILTSVPSSNSLKPVGGWEAYLNGTDVSGREASGLILTTDVIEKVETHQAPRVAKVKQPKEPSKLLTRLRGMSRKQMITVGIVGLIGIVLTASIIFGLIKRMKDQRAKQIAYTKEEVGQKLQQAEDVAFLNSGRAAGLISDAKHDVAQLQSQLGGTETKDIKDMNDMIAQKEAAIFKKEEKKPEEFFDLGIEDKNANGKLLSRNGSRAAIMNPDGSVYVLNLEKKSLDKQSSGVKNASAVALSDNATFVLGSDGIIQIDQDGKTKKIIEKDNDWGRITGMVTFNNNLYLLDGGKGQVIKYVPAGDGYGGKTSYVKGNAPSLVSASSIAIDSSVYVANGASIIKFTSGLQEGFAPQFPDSGVTLTKIDTADDVEKVYAWDKPRGLLYIMSKNGSYERQIKSAALKTADDIAVTKTDVYILQGQKIYKIGVN